MTDTPGDERTLYDVGTQDPNSQHHHVDVQQAERTFEELSRALSRRSTTGPTVSKKPSKTESTSTYNGKDVEKGGAAEDGETSFNLREYLRTSYDANENAGIKSKHVGVTWEGLKVDVVGGADYKVGYFCWFHVSSWRANLIISGLRPNLRWYVIRRFFVVERVARLTCNFRGIVVLLALAFHPCLEID